MVVQFSRSVVSNSLRPRGLQHARPPCPSPTLRVYSNSCSLSCWCHPTISFSVIPFSSCLQSFPASGSFQMSQFFASGGQSIGVSASASVLPMNIQDWFPLGLAGLIFLLSKGLSGIFSNISVIQVCAPNADAEEAEVDQFFEDLQDFLELTPRNVLFIIGDWNAKEGSQERDTWHNRQV